jgi:putative tryptophan/tyrosine transport system substrate-binding protein
LDFGLPEMMKRKGTRLAAGAKVARIGYLSVNDPASRGYRIEAFRQGLKQVSGKTLGGELKVVSSQWSVVSKSVFCFALSALLLALCLPAGAQQPKKVSRIGYLSSGEPASDVTRNEAIRLALRERGYTEGQNIAIEYVYGEGKIDRYPELAAELVRLKVDLIVVAGGAEMVWAAKNATKTIPIVMAGGGTDPVKAGLIESLARPGGNVTGITTLSRELGGKRLELFKEAVPKVGRIAVLYDPAAPSPVSEVKEVLPVAARALGLTLQPWEVRGTDNFDTVFAAMVKQRSDSLYLLESAQMRANRKRIVAFALKSRLPSVYDNRGAVDSGGLMSYHTDPADRYRRIAYFVDRILKGAKPADLPVEQPSKFELVINLKTAKALGLKIPAHLLMEADGVIK